MSNSSVRTVIDLIEERAQTTPDRPWSLVPRSEELEDGFVALTYSHLARAIDRTAWWLDKVLVRVGDHDTIVYQGPNDVRWAFIIFAAQKTGRNLLVLNPNNSLEADHKLISERDCRNFLIAQGHKSRFQKWLEERPSLQSVDFPNLEHWLAADDSVEQYRYVRPSSFEEALSIPWEIIQTSGTTGQPKQIHFNVAYQHVMCEQKRLWDNGAFEAKTIWQRYRGQKVLMPFPQTWSAGIALLCDLAIVWEFVPVLCPPNSPQPVPPQTIADTLQYSGATAAIVLPFYIKQLAKDPKYLSILESIQLDLVGYAGAGLDRETLEIVQPHIKILQPNYGNTDVGSFPIFVGESGDVDFVGFSPKLGCVFEKISSPGDEEVFELVLDRSQDKHQLIYYFHTHPDEQEYRSNDCFTRHPDPAKSNFWRHVGRKDDLVKNHLLTKTNASQVESMLDRVDFVNGVCFGHFEAADGRKISYLLIEINAQQTSMSDHEIVQTIWPQIEAANEHMSEEIRLKRDNVIITPTNKPLPRLGKGTINRRAIPEIYVDDLARLNRQSLPN